MANQQVKDMQSARDKGSFDPELLTEIIYGSHDRVLKRRQLQQLLRTVPEFNTESWVYEGREKRIYNALSLQSRIIELIYEGVVGTEDQTGETIIDDVLIVGKDLEGGATFGQRNRAPK